MAEYQKKLAMVEHPEHSLLGCMNVIFESETLTYLASMHCFLDKRLYLFMLRKLNNIWRTMCCFRHILHNSMYVCMHWSIKSETLTLIIFVFFRRLKSVMEDDALYASYFWWKDFYQVRTEALDNAQVMMTLNNLHHDHFDKLRRLSLSWHAKGFLWLLFYDLLNSNEFVQFQAFCDLCEALHKDTKPQVYSDLHHW